MTLKSFWGEGHNCFLWRITSSKPSKKAAITEITAQPKEHGQLILQNNDEEDGHVGIPFVGVATCYFMAATNRDSST